MKTFKILTMSLSFIQHKGKTILYVDYSKCVTVEETIHLLEKVRIEYTNTVGKYLILNNFTNAIASNEYMDLARKYGKEILDARTERCAALGITGLKKIFLSAYNITVKNKMIAFETKQDALDFLVKEPVWARKEELLFASV